MYTICNYILHIILLYNIPLYFISLQIYANNICIINFFWPKKSIKKRSLQCKIRKESKDQRSTKCYFIEECQLFTSAEKKSQENPKNPFSTTNFQPLSPLDFRFIKNKLNNEVTLNPRWFHQSNACCVSSKLALISLA